MVWRSVDSIDGWESVVSAISNAHEAMSTYQPWIPVDVSRRRGAAWVRTPTPPKHQVVVCPAMKGLKKSLVRLISY